MQISQSWRPAARQHQQAKSGRSRIACSALPTDYRAAQRKFVPCRIVGVGSAAPEHVISNDDLSKLVDTNDEWITSRTGIKRRQADNSLDSKSHTEHAVLALKLQIHFLFTYILPCAS